MSKQTRQIAELAFANRRNSKGKIGKIVHRQMSRRELEELLAKAWKGALEDAAQIVARHEDDDERPMAMAICSIVEEIRGAA